jgi:hypothetical protein
VNCLKEQEGKEVKEAERINKHVTVKRYIGEEKLRTFINF